MHMTRGWTGLRTAVIALGIIAWTTTGAKADAAADSTAPRDRSTRPWRAVTGANVISFVPRHQTLSIDATLEPAPGFLPGRRPAGRRDHHLQQHSVQHHIPAHQRTMESP